MIEWSDPATYCNLTFHQTPGLGVGLGANVLVRLARRRPKLVEGLVLINCSSTSSGWLEWAHHKVANCTSRLSEKYSNVKEFSFVVIYGFLLVFFVGAKIKYPQKKMFLC